MGSRTFQDAASISVLSFPLISRFHLLRCSEKTEKVKVLKSVYHIQSDQIGYCVTSAAHHWPSARRDALPFLTERWRNAFSAVANVGGSE